jgi:hypothetical protein
MREPTIVQHISPPYPRSTTSPKLPAGTTGRSRSQSQASLNLRAVWVALVCLCPVPHHEADLVCRGTGDLSACLYLRAAHRFPSSLLQRRTLIAQRRCKSTSTTSSHCSRKLIASNDTYQQPQSSESTFTIPFQCRAARKAAGASIAVLTDSLESSNHSLKFATTTPHNGNNDRNHVTSKRIDMRTKLNSQNPLSIRPLRIASPLPAAIGAFELSADHPLNMSSSPIHAHNTKSTPISSHNTLRYTELPVQAPSARTERRLNARISRAEEEDYEARNPTTERNQQEETSAG